MLDLAVYGFLCLFVTTLLTMGFGVVGLLHPTPILVAGVAGLALLGWAWRSGRLAGGPWGPHFAALWDVRPRGVCIVLPSLVHRTSHSTGNASQYS